MTISPVSYSNYQNFANIRSYNKIRNNPQVSVNQVAFKGGVEKVVEKTAQEVATQNSAKILTALATLGVTTLSCLGIKTSKEKELNELLEKRTAYVNGCESGNLKKTNRDLYKEINKYYSENPELVKKLLSESYYYEEVDSNRNKNTCQRLLYTLEDIITICEINKINPSLTSLAEKIYGGEIYERESIPKIREKVKNAILNEPEKVEKVLEGKDFEEDKAFKEKWYGKNFYRPSTLLPALYEYNTTHTPAFIDAKQKAQDKFGIEIIKVFECLRPSKGDQHCIRYMYNGEVKNYYLDAPPGGNTKSEVLEMFIKKYNNMEELLESEKRKQEALLAFEKKQLEAKSKADSIIKTTDIDDTSSSSYSKKTTSKSSKKSESSAKSKAVDEWEDWLFWTIMQGND